MNLVQTWGKNPYYIIVEMMSCVMLLCDVWSTDSSLPFLIQDTPLLRNVLQIFFDLVKQQIVWYEDFDFIVCVDELFVADWRRLDF